MKPGFCDQMGPACSRGSASWKDTIYAQQRQARLRRPRRRIEYMGDRGRCFAVTCRSHCRACIGPRSSPRCDTDRPQESTRCWPPPRPLEGQTERVCRQNSPDSLTQLWQACIEESVTYPPAPLDGHYRCICHGQKEEGVCEGIKESICTHKREFTYIHTPTYTCI